MVCGTRMRYFLTKRFDSWGLGSLDYDRCPDCGFAICATLLQMPDEEWVALNNWFHVDIYKVDLYNRGARLDGQSKVIDLFLRYGLVSSDEPVLDWGAGTGDLAARLKQRGRAMYSYDRYIKPIHNPLPTNEPAQRSFALVTAGAVFEHLKSREELDTIEALVSETGVLGFHILIPECIPEDENWIYLLPVHCAFHTWESMRRLMVQWGYKSCVYCQEALMWFFFRQSEGVKDKVDLLNSEQGYQYLLYSEGFISASGAELPLVEANHSGELRRVHIGVTPRQITPGWECTSLENFLVERSLPNPAPHGSFLLGPAEYDEIYSDAVAERMTPIQFRNYLECIKSLLKVGGVHRIATTDLSRVLENARSDSWREFAWVKNSGVSTASEYLNTVFRSWGHCYLYDSELLLKTVFEAGYRNIRMVTRGTSRSKTLGALDSGYYRLYVEACR